MMPLLKSGQNSASVGRGTLSTFSSQLPSASSGAGQLSLDAKIGELVRGHFQFRYVVMRDGREAAELERAVRRGALGIGKPFLIPL